MNSPALANEAVQIRRARQLFSFLKAFAERNQPIQRDIRDQLWSLRLRELPKHPCVHVGEVTITGSSEQVPDDGLASPALLTVRRPNLTPAPLPPPEITDFLRPGWEKADGSIHVMPARNIRHGFETETETFEDDPLRVAALEEWRTRWNRWAEAELPALAAMRTFSSLYDLHGRIERETEHVELVLGDGHLRWRSVNGTVDHPMLLQRVELHFNASVPEFTVLDADRGPELYTVALFDDQQVSPAQLKQLRDELEQGGYHPLAGEATSGFLRGLVQRLSARGVFHEEMHQTPASENSTLMRDPVLFLRIRPSGYSAAFDRVLEDLARCDVLPVALTRLVGVEPPVPQETITQPASPWGEPPDVLLSKPANAEQVQIARALERHRAVLVQGPPGTGKSHTIANLIGHLVAHGKRVLVTSHTTKALRVLRDQVVEALRPLCVAVLENDLESRKQMENAVRAILSRLTTSSEETLADEVVRLTEERSDLNAKIARVTRDLQTARAAEYEPIVIEGEPHDPADAARWVRDRETESSWIPGQVDQGAPLPLSTAEIADLYATNGLLAEHEDQEIAGGLPEGDVIPDPQRFRAWVCDLETLVSHQFDPYWVRPSTEPELPALENLARIVNGAAADLGRMEKWQLAVVGAGRTSEGESELWRDLASQIGVAAKAWEGTRKLLLDHDVVRTPESPDQDVSVAVREIIHHLQNGGRLGRVTLLMHPDWKRAIRVLKVNGAQPATSVEFRAISAHLAIEDGRKRLATRWLRQAEPTGLPKFESMPSPPEPGLREFAAQFDDLLAWWPRRWRDIAAAMDRAGFRWGEFRRDQVAHAAPASPFDRDVSILRGGLQQAVGWRAAQARLQRADRLVRELDVVLAPFTGPVCSTVRTAVQMRNADQYESAWNALVRLIAKKEIWDRRRELLGRLRNAAPGWSEAVERRAGVHGQAVAPSGVHNAWRWRQLQQEIDRRGRLDEVSMTQKLEQYRADLRNVTATLIDRRAWLGQKRRIDLQAQQALQGWSDIQRRIGRGTGRRVPALQAEARKQLVKARGAVPVWIMPLSRVAESFDPQSRFDVVIVDEASQSDVTGLLAWYLGDRIAVVGDHEQVSPLAVGQQIAPMAALIGQYLQEIPNNVLYDGKASIYDLARQSFGGMIALREHFRCVPDIIEFSNELSYDFEIRPLRNGGSVPRPHVVEYVVGSELRADRTGKSNLAEAHTIVSLLKACMELPEYDGKTMGAITLLGDEQASLIQDLAVSVIDAVELERRRFVAGNAAQFQGDERHVVFLSMVDVSGGTRLRLSQTDALKQRYNVAASRAKDQLWLVHCLDPEHDLQQADLRYRLINYVRNPGAHRRAVELARSRAESPFERAIIERLIGSGFCVKPQVWVGQYRIDMVVSDGPKEIALECDGDRHHGIDQIPHDMARQAVLERAGWRFIRVRGTRFYRDPERTTAWLLGELEKAGIRPAGQESEAKEPEDAAIAFRESVVRRAWEIMRAEGWVPEVPDNDQSDGEGTS